MKLLLALLLLLFCYCPSHAQIAITADTTDKPTNSFAPIYRHSNLTLHYHYNESTQTHNYSGNWDFDGDGIKDSLYFVGTGGAHLYFFLRIILSSDKKIRDFPDPEMDFPTLGNASDLVRTNNELPLFPTFVVSRFHGGNRDEIYLSLDENTYLLVKDEWKKHGIRTSHILLHYKNGLMLMMDFAGK